MKKSDFYEISNDKIQFRQTQHTYTLDQIRHIEILTETFRKKGMQSLTNTLTAALPFHYGDGNEKVMLKIKITTDQGKEYICLHEEPLTKGTMDYYDMERHAQNLKRILKKECCL